MGGEEHSTVTVIDFSLCDVAFWLLRLGVSWMSVGN